MTVRFNRTFELAIGLGDQAVIVKPLIRISFTVDKSIFGGLNKATIKIWNLKEFNRLKLVKDEEDQIIIPVVLKVGYGDDIETIFQGTVFTGSNVRNGVDTITNLDCFDGGQDFLFKYTSTVVAVKQRVIDVIVAELDSVTIGKVTKQPVLFRPKVLVGNSLDIIRRSIAEDEQFYIDDEQIFIIKEGDVTRNFIPLVTAETGLIDTPQRKNKRVTFQTLMNPTVKIGGRAELISNSAPHLNDIYKVQDINYTGDLEGESAAWVQTITGAALVNLAVV